MMEEKSVEVQLANGRVVACKIEIAQARPWRLTFSGMELESTGFLAEDLFSALIGLRKELEKIGAQILCAGARIDVYPSAMSRQASGRKAYVTRTGSPASRADLLDIFDQAQANAVGSIAQQESFHQQWMTSLR